MAKNQQLPPRRLLSLTIPQTLPLRVEGAIPLPIYQKHHAHGKGLRRKHLLRLLHGPSASERCLNALKKAHLNSGNENLLKLQGSPRKEPHLPPNLTTKKTHLPTRRFLTAFKYPKASRVPRKRLKSQRLQPARSVFVIEL